MGPEARAARPWADLDLAAIRRAVLSWSAAHRRPLALREDRTPYRVLVGEVMSLQTRAEAVAGYLDAFLERFPSPQALAQAPEQDVLRAWQGLGYYRRALQLRRAAAQIVARHGGQVPADPAALRALPGVGPYVAAAVASLAFGQDEPAVDGGVTRVLARLGDVRAPVDAPAGAAAVRALARVLLPAGAAAAWNEGLMDLGALLCVPRRPRCAACPLYPHCRARAAGSAAQLPVRRPRPRPLPVPVVTVVLRRGARLGVCRRGPGGLLAGMWEFPTVEGAEEPQAVAERFALCWRDLRAVTEFDYAFTHRRWRVRAYAAEVPGRAVQARGAPPSLRWVTARALAALPLTGPALRVAAGAGLPLANR